jgi:hypothetical protein
MPADAPRSPMPPISGVYRLPATGRRAGWQSRRLVVISRWHLSHPSFASASRIVLPAPRPIVSSSLHVIRPSLRRSLRTAMSHPSVIGSVLSPGQSQSPTVPSPRGRRDRSAPSSLTFSLPVASDPSPCGQPRAGEFPLPAPPGSGSGEPPAPDPQCWRAWPGRRLASALRR